MSGVRFIGPVEVDILDPAFTWTSEVRPGGLRAVVISGEMAWTPGQQLSELVANYDQAVTIGGITGILDVIYADDVLLSSFNGWYLLQSFALSPTYQHSSDGVDGFLPFTLNATHLGSYEPAS